jgi:SAM-dependent methyltransferase
MLRPYLRRKVKIARGVWNTHVAGKSRFYDDSKWWDESFYTEGVSDRQTLSAKKSQLTAKYHYCSVELKILRHLSNYGIDTKGSIVLDIGAGSGHWIDFYRSLGSSRTIALDVSRASVEYLKDKYVDHPDVSILRGNASAVIPGLDARFDIVNAVGVMFHLVDDAEWLKTIQRIAGVMSSKGMFVTSGHFGVIDGLNVQIDRNDRVNKRLRSGRHWRKALKDAGFNTIRIYRNNAYLWIRDALPENHVLIATK